MSQRTPDFVDGKRTGLTNETLAEHVEALVLGCLIVVKQRSCVVTIAVMKFAI